MLQIEIIEASTLDELTNKSNVFLSTLKSEQIKKINVDSDKCISIIHYEIGEFWKNCLCSECKHWDDGESSDSIMGLCQAKGGRKRFNCKACEKFADVRE